VIKEESELSTPEFSENHLEIAANFHEIFDDDREYMG
jgi:hypothetical protein